MMNMDIASIMINPLHCIMTKRALIIGGGFAGCAAAHQLSLKGGWEVILVESAPFLGAGVRTQWWGGHPYTFGPRHFLTQKPEIFEFLNRYCPIRLCPEHEFITYVERDQQFYNFPINTDDIPRMPDSSKIYEELQGITLEGVQAARNLEDYWIASVGKTLYDKFIDTYSKKMWQVSSNDLIDTFSWSPKGVALKTGNRAAWDSALSGYPYAANGYDDYFDIATEETTVLLSTIIENFDIENKRVYLNGEWKTFDLIINTISPDTLFDYCYGELPFVGRDFHKIVLPIENAFPKDVFFVYYVNSEAFTRIVEYKKFTNHVSQSTLLGLEIPSKNGKHYPLPIKSEIARARKYLDLMPEGVFSIGRAGSYLYSVDIDDCIDQAIEIGKLL